MIPRNVDIEQNIKCTVTTPCEYRAANGLCCGWEMICPHEVGEAIITRDQRMLLNVDICGVCDPDQNCTHETKLCPNFSWISRIVASYEGIIIPTRVEAAVKEAEEKLVKEMIKERVLPIPRNP